MIYRTHGTKRDDELGSENQTNEVGGRHILSVRFRLDFLGKEKGQRKLKKISTEKLASSTMVV